jgi:hypothetical protein
MAGMCSTRESRQVGPADGADMPSDGFTVRAAGGLQTTVPAGLFPHPGLTAAPTRV